MAAAAPTTRRDMAVAAAGAGVKAISTPAPPMEPAITKRAADQETGVSFSRRCNRLMAVNTVCRGYTNNVSRRSTDDVTRRIQTPVRPLRPRHESDIRPVG